MSLVQPPETATLIGCLEDDTFETDGPAHAHGIRELMRAGNTRKDRGALMFRRLGSTRGTLDEVHAGNLAGFLWPFWFTLFPEQDFPALKMPGLAEMRVAARLAITSGRDGLLQVNTRAQPFQNDPPAADVLTMSGTGSSARYTKEDVPIHPGGEEESLTFLVRGVVDPDGDPLLATGTYGGANSGTVTQLWPEGLFFDSALGTPWNTSGSQVHTGGHYVVFRSAGDNRIVAGPFAVLDVYRESPLAGEGLFFWPPIETSVAVPLTGLEYEIRTLARYKVDSVAAYAVSES